MRKSLLKAILLISLIVMPAGCQKAIACIGGCPEGTCSLASITFDIPKSVITADTLAILLKSGNISLIECRSSRQQIDMSIPDAMVIRDDVAIASIAELLPARERLIVIYPGVEGGNIAAMINELRKLGFQSIVEFQAGVPGWLTYGYKATGENAP